MTKLVFTITTSFLVFFFWIQKRKRANPKSSYIMGILNIMLSPLRHFGISPFNGEDCVDIKRIMKDCARNSRLTDFGDLSFVDDYRAITEYPLYKSLRFSNLGIIMATMELEMVAQRRLMLTQYLKDVPEVLSVPVESPVFVFGLGRSGTTFIHRLLSLDPICRAPLLWEMLYPVPSLHCPSISQTDLNADRDLRAEFVKQRIQSRNQMGDQTMENLHEVGFDLPEECLFNLSDELPFSFHYLCTILRRFSAFLRHTPSSRILAAYESHKRILQLLAFQTGERGHGGRRWMLKCPLHIWFLREIHQVFPDAKFVWAHRCPSRTLSSACSLVEGMHHLYYEQNSFDLHQLGKDIAGLAKDMLEAGTKAINDLSLDCAHVNFDRLVSDPIGVVQDIYRHFGWTISDEYARILKEFLDADKIKREEVRKRKGGRSDLHEHSLSHYGLKEEDFSNDKFQTYLAEYGLQEMRK